MGQPEIPEACPRKQQQGIAVRVGTAAIFNGTRVRNLILSSAISAEPRMNSGDRRILKFMALPAGAARPSK